MVGEGSSITSGSGRADGFGPGQMDGKEQVDKKLAEFQGKKRLSMRTNSNVLSVIREDNVVNGLFGRFDELRKKRAKILVATARAARLSP